jgi:flagellar biosynthesis protein FlhG
LVKRGHDQAHGLRRMFCESPPRVIEIAAGRDPEARVSVAVNLGAALARSGCRTLLVDCARESSGAPVLRYLGRRSRGFGAEAGSAVLPRTGPEGFAVFELAREPWGHASSARGTHAGEKALPREAACYDCVLLSGSSIEPVLVADSGLREVVLLLSPSAASIVDAYSLIKRLTAHGVPCRFRVVVDRIDSETAARRVFQNLARVAYGYLDIRLEMIGFVPADPWVARAAAQGCSVIECDPDAPAARAYGRLARTIAAAGRMSMPAPVPPGFVGGARGLEPSLI